MPSPVPFRSITVLENSDLLTVRRLAVEAAEAMRSHYFPGQVMCSVSIEAVCEELGISIGKRSDTLHCTIYPIEDSWHIALPIYTGNRRRRSDGAAEWLLGHELGHTLLDKNIKGTYSPAEYFCDTFAAAFHVPPWMATRGLTEAQPDFSLIDPDFPSLTSKRIPLLHDLTGTPRLIIAWALDGYSAEKWTASVRKRILRI